MPRIWISCLPFYLTFWLCPSPAQTHKHSMSRGSSVCAIKAINCAQCVTDWTPCYWCEDDHTCRDNATEKDCLKWRQENCDASGNTTIVVAIVSLIAVLVIFGGLGLFCLRAQIWKRFKKPDMIAEDREALMEERRKKYQEDRAARVNRFKEKYKMDE